VKNEELKLQEKTMNIKENTSRIKYLPLKGVGGSVWLFLELVVITVVAWVVFDPAIVNIYNYNLPMGYDHDRLLYAQTEYISHYPEVSDEEKKIQIIRQLKSMDEVENVNIHTNPNREPGYYYPNYEHVSLEQDTLYLAYISFLPNANFFETYGIKPLPGSPSAEELSTIDERSNQVVLTRQAAITLFGTENVVGRHFQNLGYDQEPIQMTIAGVVEDIRSTPARSIRSLIFTPSKPETTAIFIIIRLKDGINSKRFIEEHGRELIAKGKTDFCRISQLTTFDDHLQEMELDAGRPQEVNRSLALALFFLLNLCLAVIGTVWLQAKRRTEECGVRRAYGATKPRLLLSFLAEGALMATIACVIGCVIFLNYAYSGLEINDGIEYFTTMHGTCNHLSYSDRTWVEFFWPHFLIVSGVVYLIILCTVLIGTAIPALKIINTRITNSLRE
jgi:ABC-type antimicrobial peptide transport system permease subunit